MCVDRVRKACPLAVRRLCAVFLMAGLACNTVPVDQTPGGSNNTGGSQSTGGTSASVSASLLEQLSLERINRARLLPAAEAAANNIAIDEGVPGQLNTLPKPPVALNAKLNSAARGHSQDMLARDYFEHNTPEGRTPFQRMEAAGYTFIAAAENLAWRGTTGTADERAYVEAQHVDLFVDTDIPGRGHRLTLLNGNLREVGISIIRGSFTSNGVPYDSVMQTQDYGTSPSGSTFVLGVVYSDGNNNGQYDYGEGVSSSVVSLGPASKTTNAAGGYSFEVFEPGAYTLRFSSSGRSQTLNISQGAPNIKVDLVDGTRVVVNLGVGPL